MIIPTILCKTSACAKRRISLIESTAQTVQIDIMDGLFVPNETWHDADAASTWSFNVDYELHLMVNDPLPIIHAWKRVPRLRRAIIHAETPKKLSHLIKEIKPLKIKIGIAISPGTPLKKIIPHINDIEMVLVMGGKPGFGGQPIDLKTLKTVQELRRSYPKLPIGFDIGVSEQTIPELKKAGVTRYCIGSAIFKKRSPIEAFEKLESLTR